MIFGSDAADERVRSGARRRVTWRGSQPSPPGSLRPQQSPHREVPVSPRRNRPHKPAAQGSRGAGDEEGNGVSYGHGGTVEEWRGEEWVVRAVAGAASSKRYRCPGCDQEIAAGTPHVVAWREHAGVDDRRHWHRACWNAKERRTSKVQRSRNAPRY